jgi:ATP-dependent DNA ligase
VKARENLAGVSSTSKSQDNTILPRASIAEIVLYVEYDSRPVPRAPRSNKRMRVDDASARVSSTRKPHQSSTHLGTQVVGSMLLGEHFNIFVFFVVYSCP